MPSRFIDCRWQELSAILQAEFQPSQFTRQCQSTICAIMTIDSIRLIKANPKSCHEACYEVTQIVIFTSYGNVLIKYSPPLAPPNAALVTRKWSPPLQLCPGLASDLSGSLELGWAPYSRNWTRSQGQGSDLPSLKHSPPPLDCEEMVRSEGSGETWSLNSHSQYLKRFLKPLCVCTQPTTHHSQTFYILHSKECYYIWFVCVCLSFYCDDDALHNFPGWRIMYKAWALRWIVKIF